MGKRVNDQGRSKGEQAGHLSSASPNISDKTLLVTILPWYVYGFDPGLPFKLQKDNSLVVE